MYISWPWRAAALSIALAVSGCGGSGGNTPEPPQQQALTLNVLSTRADLVTDGNALVEVQLPANASASALKVKLNNTDISSAFGKSADGRILGLVTGMAVGTNQLSASTAGAAGADLVITNAPRSGPIVSGTQTVPYVCATPAATPESGNTPATRASGLTTTATDSQCTLSTEYRYFYRTTTVGCSTANPDPAPPATAPANACFRRYDPASPPSDMATVTTASGATVPYIVRVEKGTINRGIYSIAVLFDPTKDWKATSPQAQWSNKLVMVFGGGTGSTRLQAPPATSWVDEDALRSGYVVAVNSFFDGGTNSNRVLMSETIRMMKEHVVDTYGPLKFTMGKGCSGGSNSLQTNAALSPGVIDGIIVTCTLTDAESIWIEVNDCILLVEAFDSTAWRTQMTAAGYTQADINARKAAIAGTLDHKSCIAWSNAFANTRFSGNRTVSRSVPAANIDTGVIVQTTLPTPANVCNLPAAMVYDPVTNPNGVRCSQWDWAASVWGYSSGLNTNKTRDNVGVQYGLVPLRAGKITPEEFVVLNEVVGGMDQDGKLQAGRMVADLPALEIAYRSGIVPNGRQAPLAKTPVIDLKGNDEQSVHSIWHSYGVRARLDAAMGHHRNHVLIRFGRTGLTPPAWLDTYAFRQMDEWLTRLQSTAGDSVESRVVAAKPAALVDGCILSTEAAQATLVTDMTQCDADPLLAKNSTPRQSAGGPLAENVLKCHLKPLDAADYRPALLTAGQLARLNAVFAAGVCDWSRPGVKMETEYAGALTFMAGPGGRPLPAAPASTPN